MYQFMKRKEDAEERKQTEQVLQKSFERSHWTTTTSTDPSDDPMTGNKMKLIVEYDNSASGINSVVSGGAPIGRIQFGGGGGDIEESESGKQVSKNPSTQQPQNKIPKLK